MTPTTTTSPALPSTTPLLVTKSCSKRVSTPYGFCISSVLTHKPVIVPQYVDFWSNLFFLNETFTKDIKDRAEKCNYTSYLETYLTFPPPQESFPTLPDPYLDESAAACDLWDDVYAAALEVNPCFNIYHITETCPHPYSVLGIVNSGDYKPPGLEVYFNRTDVQAAINAPVGTDWAQCTDINVFVGQGDQSPGPALDGTLQNVIERTNNVIIGSGNLDYILSTNGTLLALQNLTWNGAQGLQEYPGKPFFSPYHPEVRFLSSIMCRNLLTWVHFSIMVVPCPAPASSAPGAASAA